MRRPLAILLLACAPAWAKEITTEKELFAAAAQADFVGCLAISTHPPRAEVLRVWKPADSAPLAAAVRRSVNAYVLKTPDLLPPKHDDFYLLLCAGPIGVKDGVPGAYSKVDMLPMENRCVMLEGKKISVDDIKKATRQRPPTAGQE